MHRPLIRAAVLDVSDKPLAVIALPVKIRGGSGRPRRIIARLPR